MADQGLVADTKLLTSLEQLDTAELDLSKGNPNGLRYILDIEKILL